jgi:hypothetical protein
MKWILYYLIGTINIDLIYNKSHNARSFVEGIIDSNYIGDLDRRRLLIIYVSTLLGCAISWKEILQSIIALSIMEAEYMKLTTKKVWLIILVCYMGWLLYIIIVGVLFDTTKRLMSSPKCRSVEVINNPARPGSNHREVNCINYKQQ